VKVKVKTQDARLTFDASLFSIHAQRNYRTLKSATQPAINRITKADQKK
jgi:hypothetical protein